MTWTPTVLHRKTDHRPREIVRGHQATAQERADLDYVDWAAVERGEESFSGFRFRGELFDLGEFSSSEGTLASDYDRWLTESAFSAIAVKYTDHEHVVVTYLHW